MFLNIFRFSIYLFINKKFQPDLLIELPIVMTSTNQNETLLNSKEICKLELNDKEIELKWRSRRDQNRAQKKNELSRVQMMQ